MTLSAKRLATATCGKLESVKARLLAIAAEWEDLDECFRGDLERAAETVGTIINDVRELYPKRKAGAR